MRDGHNLENVLNDLPKCWKVAPLGLTSWVRARLGWKGLKAEEYVEEGIAFLSTPDIKNREINYQKVNRITHERYSESSEIALRVGDVLLTKDGSTIGVVHLVRTLPEPTTVNGSIAVITPSERWESLFLGYVLESSWAQALMSRLQDGMGVPHLFQRDIKRLRLPLPPLETQQRIADYLDRETAEIDAAVEDLDKYVELLNVKLESASREVFTELSANHPLIQTKFLVDITTGSGDTQDSQENGGFPFYVRSDTIQRAEDFEFDCDAVLTSGDGAGVGKIFHLASGKFKAHQRVYVMHNFRRVSPEYFYWMFKSAFPDVIRYGGAKSTVDSVRMPMIANLKLPVPDKSTQEEISGRLANLYEEVGSLISESTKLRDLLLKRRSVLITEVVTGRKQV